MSKFINKPKTIKKIDIEKYLKKLDKTITNQYYDKPIKKTANTIKPAKTIDVLQVSAIMKFSTRSEKTLDDLIDTVQPYALVDIDTAAFSLGNDDLLNVVAFRIVIRVSDAPMFLQTYGSWIELNSDLVTLQDMDITLGTATQKD